MPLSEILIGESLAFVHRPVNPPRMSAGAWIHPSIKTRPIASGIRIMAYSMNTADVPNRPRATALLLRLSMTCRAGSFPEGEGASSLRRSLYGGGFWGQPPRDFHRF